MKAKVVKEIMVPEQRGLLRSGDRRKVGREREKLLAICLSIVNSGKQSLQGVEWGHTNRTTVIKIQQIHDHKATQQ